MEATFTPAPATGATFAPAAARATFVPADLKATFGGVVAGLGARPHHAIVLGAVVGAAGGLPVDAALTAAYLSVSGPASAAVRLLGLDPFAVNGVVVALSEWMRDVAERAAECAARDPAELPAPAAPGLDLLAEAHRRHHEKEVRLFAS
ncbi:MAG TPA: urease accessory UreF family protein [Actinophytocola sp.]|nr:urease accessory UreF family protein [Actinophytocola sp.]HEV2781687.1 urease accessory UreF family protein [Actinophytocola sp.]